MGSTMGLNKSWQSALTISLWGSLTCGWGDFRFARIFTPLWGKRTGQFCLKFLDLARISTPTRFWCRNFGKIAAICSLVNWITASTRPWQFLSTMWIFVVQNWGEWRCLTPYLTTRLATVSDGYVWFWSFCSNCKPVDKSRWRWKDSGRLLLLLLNCVTTLNLFSITWSSWIDFFPSHQQSNLEKCWTVLNTWLKFYLLSVALNVF